MSVADILSIAVVVGAINAVLGYWAKSRIEGSIKHEYDRRMEDVKAAAKRADVLLAERLTVFKVLQGRLVSVRRYCESQINVRNGGEFGARPCDLSSSDNKSLLFHWTELEPLLDGNLIFLSAPSREAFERLRDQLSLGASMELALAFPKPALEVAASAINGYSSVSACADQCIEAMYKDLAFQNET